MTKPHISLAQSYWRAHLRPHDFALDMTCGNGHDTKFLSECLPSGMVYAFDIQERAIGNTRAIVGDSVKLFHRSHDDLPPLPSPPRLIVYNLGYLPGGDKTITTRRESTVRSLAQCLHLLAPDGAISITCYPGHDEGLLEEAAVLAWVQKIPQDQWNVCFTQWLNRPRAPSLVWVRRKETLRQCYLNAKKDKEQLEAQKDWEVTVADGSNDW